MRKLEIQTINKEVDTFFTSEASTRKLHEVEIIKMIDLKSDELKDSILNESKARQDSVDKLQKTISEEVPLL